VTTQKRLVHPVNPSFIRPHHDPRQNLNVAGMLSVITGMLLPFSRFLTRIRCTQALPGRQIPVGATIAGSQFNLFRRIFAAKVQS
jgi:hypothetical protein